MATSLGSTAVVSQGDLGLVQAAARAEVGVSEAWSATLNLPMQWSPSAGLTPWDAVVAGAWRPLDRPDLALELRPGLSLPLGPSGPSAPFVPGATGSFDPWLAASLVGGGDWIGLSQVRARLPVSDGRDGVRQGAWGRLDLGGGRRLGAWVLTLTASGVHRLDDETGGGGFSELAGELGATWAFSERWAATATARTPVWMNTPSRYTVAGGLSVTRVWGKAGESH